MGSIQIVIGVLCVVANLVSILSDDARDVLAAVGHGIWCGVFVSTFLFILITLPYYLTFILAKIYLPKGGNFNSLLSSYAVPGMNCGNLPLCIYSTSYTVCHPLTNLWTASILFQWEAAKYIFGAELMFLAAGLHPGIMWNRMFEVFLYGADHSPYITSFTSDLTEARKNTYSVHTYPFRAPFGQIRVKVRNVLGHINLLIFVKYYIYTSSLN